MTSTLFAPDTSLPSPEVPNPVFDLIFTGKVALLRLRRRAWDAARPVARLSRDESGSYPVLLAESVTALWSDARSSEMGNQFGKVENLRQAARRLDRIAIPVDGTFSFWKQLGKATRKRGFVAGRMLQQGCLVPAVGGGLCQLSNALYDVALRSGAEIVERHPHSRVVPGSSAEFGRDATVAWNYVDFRFRMPAATLLRVKLTKDTLVVRLLGQALVVNSERKEYAPSPSPLPRRRMSAFADGGVEGFRPSAGASIPSPHRGEGQGEGKYSQFSPQRVANDCASCNQALCHRHETKLANVVGRAAFLVDEAWPEFRDYVAAQRRAGDLLGIPLDGKRWNRPRYSWDTEGFAEIHAATWATLSRAVLARWAAKSNGRRVAAQLRGAAALAERLGRALTPDVTEVTVAQSLLPFLWRSGKLGGRRITVLMTRLPMTVLQVKLDHAAVKHAERATLADFRAPDGLAASESQALTAAARIVTPHAEVAALFPGRAVLLDWQMPDVTSRKADAASRRIVFPGPSVARKGAYELREAARRLDLEVILLGSDLEGADFWQGVRTRHVARSDSTWLDNVAAVVQPALLEEQPRLLLCALAAGVPVIATPACGLSQRPGLMLVPEGDVEALTSAFSHHISRV